MKPFLVSPRGLELFIAGDGQRFTDLIRSWANVYLRRCGASNFSINGVSWRPDGGVDGLIDDSALSDALNWLVAKTAMQFKAGTITSSEARKELLAEAPAGQERMRDKIADGFRVVWFIGRALPDLDRQAFEDKLAEGVTEVNTEAPRPIVIDLNRLAELISLTPAVALQVAVNPGLFLTSDAALKETPHSLLPTFVPGSHYPELQQDVVGFFLGRDAFESIKYIAGEPGIGKSRSILEAVESSDELKGMVCYFEDPSRVSEFFNLAKQEGWRGCAIIDEFIGQSATTTPINGDTVPSGFKLLLIGHAYATDRLSPRVTNRLEPLTEDEVQRALVATYKELPEFRIREAVQMSKDNIRLARLICDHYRRNPSSPGLDATSLSRIVAEELERMPSGHDVLKRLSILPNLLSEETSAFCLLVELDEDDFRRTCRQVSQSSALIQFNDHVAYIGSPAVAQMALIRLWNEETELAKRILTAAGDFSERILTAINKLPACAEKEAMLGFFTVQIADLKLHDLIRGEVGTRFLKLLTADPETYLPVLHRLVMAERGHLDEFPYEGVSIGRRDIVWRLRELAQFPEYFLQSEEIVYAFSREEAPSAYSNTASSYWVGWFQAYFDHTTFPYEERLNLLERRIREGDDLDRSLAIRALADPFPDVGTDIPSSRVGGRVAPPELSFIHQTQIQTAAERVPHLVRQLLSCASQAIIADTAKMVLQSRFSWLERGAWEQYLSMIELPEFPEESRKQLVAETRYYVDLGEDREDEPDERVRWLRAQHNKLLERINDPDPVITVLELADHGMWRGDQPGTTAHRKLTSLIAQCQADLQLFRQAVEILGDPAKTGGGTFGRLVGETLGEEQFEIIQGQVRNVGFSQFTYSALSSAAQKSSERQNALLSFALEMEAARPQVAIGIYQMMGDDTFYREGARMLATSNTSAALFRGFFLRSSAEVSESMWSFVSALANRHESGDSEATDILATIAGEFARNEIDDERGFRLGLTALQNTASKRSRNALAEWSDVALWVYKRFPEETILLAASREQSEFSEATAALAEIAKLDSKAVLDGLRPKLKHPHRSPFLLNGGLLPVIQNVKEDVFESWLKEQEHDVLVTLAGHLPKPYLFEEKAVVPPLTRLFWEWCTPEMGDAHRRALDNFGAHTFNTGVFWGHGIDLFSTRIQIGKQLRQDPNSSIRVWAERHLDESEKMLNDAIRSQRIDEAQRATDD